MRRLALAISIIYTIYIAVCGQVVQANSNHGDLAVEKMSLILDPVLEPAVIPVESEQIIEEPNLFPRDSVRSVVKPAEAVERRESDVSGRAEEHYSSISEGAASAFGINSEGSMLTRPSISGAQAEREFQRMMARAERQASLEHYNFRVGSIPFRFGAGIDLQFSDNVNLSKTNRQADLSIFPHVDLYGGVRITSQNALSIQLGIGYIWNVNRSDLDRALTNASVGLDTDSGISFDFKLGNFQINVHERPAIPRQQFDLVTQRSPLQYSQFTNVAGISAFWNVNTRLSISLQYDNLYVMALRDELDNLNQSSNRFGLAISYRMNSALSLRLHSNASYTSYDRNFLNESSNYDSGVGIVARVGKNTTLSFMCGYQHGSFGSTGEIDDQSSLSDWYLRISINNGINSFLSHTLSLGHESQIGTVSNSTVVDYVRYELSGTFAKSLSIAAIMSLDSARESGGLYAEDFKLFQCGIYGYVRVARGLSIRAGYRFARREAGGKGGSDELNYSENRLDISALLDL